MAHKNIVSVDVEDYYQVEAFSRSVDRADWARYPSRVESNTRRVLDFLDESDVRATFFILGWVAERHPALLREIVARGHEPACHSYGHRLIFGLSPGEFREDTRAAKQQIEQATGVPVMGYRAPSFSITRRSAWAPGVLVELGFTYDSSIFPSRHDIYGIPDAPRRPFLIHTAAGPLFEFPMTTFRLLGNFNFPVAGGGYLRIFPSWYTRIGVRRAMQEEIPVIAYVHPWEFDPEQPRIAAPWKSRLRHYINLKRTRPKLRKLLCLAEFTSFRDSGYLEQSSSPSLEEIRL
jgi:polysaccharide deacetylase family protein (PEP-CTERM system associated)